MHAIHPFSAINYTRECSYTERALSSLSNYFYLGGSKITVIEGFNATVTQEELPWLEMACKVAAYILTFPITLLLLAITELLRRECQSELLIRTITPIAPIIIEEHITAVALNFDDCLGIYEAFKDLYSIESAFKHLDIINGKAQSVEYKTDIVDQLHAICNCVLTSDDLSLPEKAKFLDGCCKISLAHDKWLRNSCFFPMILGQRQVDIPLFLYVRSSVLQTALSVSFQESTVIGPPQFPIPDFINYEDLQCFLDILGSPTTRYIGEVFENFSAEQFISFIRLANFLCLELNEYLMVGLGRIFSTVTLNHLQLFIYTSCILPRVMVQGDFLGGLILKYIQQELESTKEIEAITQELSDLKGFQNFAKQNRFVFDCGSHLKSFENQVVIDHLATLFPHVHKLIIHSKHTETIPPRWISGLEFLHMRTTSIQAIPPGLQSLKELVIEEIKCTDFTELNNLPLLESIKISFNPHFTKLPVGFNGRSSIHNCINFQKHS
jgi:hypothetical protein